MPQSGIEDDTTHYLDWATRGRISVWRYLVVIFGGYVVGMYGGIVLVLLAPTLFADPVSRAVALQWMPVPGLLTVLLLARLLLCRPTWSLLSPAWPLPFKHFLIGAGIGLSLPLVGLIANLDAARENFVGFDGYRKLGPVLLMALVSGFIVQVAFEEILYRGAVMQFAWRIKAWVPFALIFQALLFALPHFGNVKSWGGAGISSIAPYFVMALGLGWICWRTGSLLVSTGLHFANNISIVLIAGSKDDIVASFAPILMPRSDLGETSLSILVQVALWIGGVELWLWLGRRRHQA